MRSSIDPLPSQSTEILRRRLVFLFIFGIVGTASELVLLEHYESAWQWVPLVLIGCSVPALLWRRFGGRLAMRAFQGLMGLFLAGGLTGLILHLHGNEEFALELYPSLSNFDLLVEALTGATPALAPGSLALLGWIGLLSTFDHPLLHSPTGNQEPSHDP